MWVAVYEILTALESALPEEEIQKHVRRAFDAISISSVQNVFHVTAQVLFRQGSKVVVS